MRILFMGTPEFSIASVQSIYDSKHDLVGVVTQPDRVRGRGQKVLMTPIKEWAVSKDIPVYQPEKASDVEFIDTIKELELDLVVTAAYGQLLKQSFLDIPKYGCINVHGSLLPKYRGASPMQQSIIDGCKQTGITIQYMEKRMDAGDMILQKTVELRDDETCGELHDELSALGGDCVKEVLALFEQTPTPAVIKQDEDEATYCAKIQKSMGKINWNEQTAIEINRLVRALNPWPGAFTTYNGKRLKIHTTQVIEELVKQEPGTIKQADENGLLVYTKEGVLRISTLQPEGKKSMSDVDFLRGYQVKVGEKLGE